MKDEDSSPRSWRTVLLATAGWIAYASVTAILFLPFGMAEPGQPHGLGGLGLLWAFGEWCRTWWVFVRRRPIAAGASQRRQALAIVLITSGVAAWWGLSLQGRNAFEMSEIVSAAMTTAGCWVGRYWLRRSAASATTTLPG